MADWNALTDGSPSRRISESRRCSPNKIHPADKQRRLSVLLLRSRLPHLLVVRLDFSVKLLRLSAFHGSAPTESLAASLIDNFLALEWRDASP
jgi:hypothetical protein